MEEFVDAVVRAIRQQVAGGRTYGQLAVDLNLPRGTIWHIVNRNQGMRTTSLDKIMDAAPSWLHEVLAGAPACLRGSNGKGSKGRPN